MSQSNLKIDFHAIERATNPVKARYPLKPYADRLRKVAFDVVRFVDAENLGDLWKVERDPDGSEYIVAMYDQQGIPDKVSSDWQVLSTDNYLQVFYKNNFVTKIALHGLGMTQEGISKFYPEIERRLTTDKSFVKSMLRASPERSVKEFLDKFPEIIK